MTTSTTAPRYRGVYYNKTRNKWRAQIFAYGCPRYIGIYDSELDAAVAYDHALWRLLPYCKRIASKPNFPDTFGQITKESVQNICPSADKLARKFAYNHSAALCTTYTESDEDLFREAFMLRVHIPRVAPIHANTPQQAVRELEELVRSVQSRALLFVDALKTHRGLLHRSINQLPTANLEGLQSQCNSVLSQIDATQAAIETLYRDLSASQILMQSQLLSGLIATAPVSSPAE